MTNEEAIMTLKANYPDACFEQLREAVDAAIEALKAQDADTDTISRKAAIDIERNATVDTNPSHFVAHQKFTQFLDDAEISSFGRWQWSNGFNTALTAVGIDLKKLPSAQPEIVRCKDCKWFHDIGCAIRIVDDSDEPSENDYCSFAERRTDEQTV